MISAESAIMCTYASVFIKIKHIKQEQLQSKARLHLIPAFMTNTINYGYGSSDSAWALFFSLLLSFFYICIIYTTACLQAFDRVWQSLPCHCYHLFFVCCLFLCTTFPCSLFSVCANIMSVHHVWPSVLSLCCSQALCLHPCSSLCEV